MDATPRRRHRSRRRIAAFLAVGSLVAASVVTAATPALAADESITVNFSAGGGSPTYRASGWIYGMTENASGAARPLLHRREVPVHARRRGAARQPGRLGVGQVRPPVERHPRPAAAHPVAGRGVHPARPRPVGRRRLPDLPLPRRQRQLDRLRQLPHPADQRRPGDGRHRCSGTSGTSPTSPCSGTAPSPSTSSCGGAPTSASGPRSRRISSSGRAAPACRRPAAGGPSTWTTSRPTTWCPTSSAGTPCPVTRWPTWRRPNTTLNSRGIPHPRPYQINEYGASNEQNPGDGSWYIARLERAGADGLRANWAGGGQPAQRPRQPARPQLRGPVPAEGRMVGLPLLRLADRPDRVGHPQRLLRRVRHQGGRDGQDPGRRRHARPATSPSTCGAWTPRAASCRTTRSGSSPSASPTTAAAPSRARSPSRTPW